jgi:hypothetical protein
MLGRTNLFFEGHLFRYLSAILQLFLPSPPSLRHSDEAVFLLARFTTRLRTFTMGPSEVDPALTPMLLEP